jgi:hypothetical protein
MAKLLVSSSGAGIVSVGGDLCSANANPTDIDFTPASPVFTASIGTVIGTAAAVDADGAKVAHVWSISGTKYAIDSNTGVVTIASALTMGTDSVTITLTDGLAVLAETFSITVADNVAPTAISFTPAQLLNNAASGAVLGTATVTDADGPVVGYAWSLTDSDSGNFTINASTGAVTSAAANLSVGSHSITIRINNGDGKTYSQIFAIPVSDNIPVPFQLKNVGGSSAVSPVVSIGMAFGPGDIPAGRKLAVFDASGDTALVTAVQQDQQTYWADGSQKFSAVSFVLPETLTAAQVRNLRMGSVSGSPDRTAGVTLANVAANSDFKIAFTGHDLGADTYEVGVNDIIANGSNWPWGTSPIRGWQEIRKGPVCTEWRFWSYLRRTSDSAFHRWIKADIYVRAWSPTGPFEVSALVRQGNIFAACQNVACTLGHATLHKKHVFISELKNGATLLKAWGGANDTRAFTLPYTSFDVATQKWNPGAHRPPSGTAWTVSTDGAMPTGTLSVDTPYWINKASDNSNIILHPERAYSTFGYDFIPAWAAGSVTTGVIRYHDRKHWLCTNGGTATTAPNGGTSPFVDGAVTWTPLFPQSSDQGSGTYTFTPLVATFPGTSFAFVGADNKPFFVGGTRPTIEYAQDFTHLTTRSKALPPFMSGITPAAISTDENYTPNTMYTPFDLNQTGAAVGDPRLGYINHASSLDLYNPFNAITRHVMLTYAYGWSDFHTAFTDERTGSLHINNNGSDKAGAAYPNLSAPDSVLRFYPYAAGSPAPMNPLGGAAYGFSAMADLDGYYERYAIWGDLSHLPAPTTYAYLVTGERMLFDILERQLSTCIGGDRYHITVGAETFYNVAGRSGQVRGAAWKTRILGYVNHFCPSSEPTRQFWTDAYNDSGDYLEAFRVANLGSPGTSLGITPNDFGVSTSTQPWQSHYFFTAVAMEAWRNETPSYLSFVSNYARRFSIDYVNPDEGGCVYYIGGRSIFIATDTPYTPYATWLDAMIAKEADGGWTCPVSGFKPDTDGVSYNAANSLVNIGAMSLVMGAVLGLTDAATILTTVRSRQSAASTMFAVSPVYAAAPF